MDKIKLILLSYFLLCLNALCVASASDQPFQLGLLTTPGTTTNSSMPTLGGIQFLYSYQPVLVFGEIAKATYKNAQLFENSTAVSNEKVEQDSKMILTLGVKGYFFDWLFWDLGAGINQFTYKTSGTDLSCCVNIDYSRSYDFSGVYIRPSIGFEYSFEPLRIGIRALSWMQYLSKSVSNKKEDPATNSYITTNLDSRDADGIQSSHMVPPHIYLLYSF